MISRVVINNFKSIKELALNPKRVNLFIGKPNTGKSNILEALGVFSLPYVNGDIRQAVRELPKMKICYCTCMENKQFLSKI